jgi:hypothetical protein
MLRKQRIEVTPHPASGFVAQLRPGLFEGDDF